MSADGTRQRLLAQLGVHPVINAHNDLTGLGGSLPQGPVLEAMFVANESFLEVDSLSDAAGVVIAEMLGIEAALVTPGAAAATVLATAACMTDGRKDLVARLPDTRGLRNEFVVQAGRRTFYDRCLEGAGGRIVPAGDEISTSEADIEEAIGERTAGIFFYAPDAPNVVPFDRVLAIAKRHHLAVIVDAAEQVYPLDNLSRYVRAGADFATYSGKFFGAGSTAGLLTGTAAGITGARRNSYLAFEGPDAQAFGRHMKVGRGEILAAYAALRSWLEMDHDRRFRQYRRLLDNMRTRLEGFSFLSFSYEDGSVTADPKPPDSLRVRFDRSRSPKTLEEVVRELHDGEPCIILRPHYRWVDPDRNYLDIRVSTLRAGQEKIIAGRLAEILGG
ncbi:MAG: hypothetical protein F4Y75_08560 [Acidimicrobiia bacterium]|nr:DegT/DnrJ/EryC1/StrS family aminotransferase [bacterium]MXZ07531.1 hypothetical protein [Acidimicrobiia bacterium]MYF26662.1 hypothetical protein [Acidimicrobiia bacterium]